MSDSLIDDELSSITLLERRKRLHELATEINQWEDESKKNAYLNTLGATGATPPPPAFPKDLLNSNRSVLSPSRRSVCNNTSVLAPSPYKYCQPPKAPSTTNMANKSDVNKENGNLSLRQKSLSPTINKNEIRDAAMRITATNSVKKMREKFENKEFSNKSDIIDDTRLAPKLLIRKFEELSSSTTTPGNPITESAIKKRMATFNTQADNLKRKFDHSSPIIDKQIKFVDDEDDVDHAELIGTTTNCYGDPEETNVLINETARNNGTICGNIDDLDCKDIDRTISNETTLAISASNNNKHSTFIKAVNVQSDDDRDSVFTYVSSINGQQSDHTDEPLYEELNTAEQSAIAKKQQIIKNFNLEVDDDDEDFNQIYDEDDSNYDAQSINTDFTQSSQQSSDTQSQYSSYSDTYQQQYVDNTESSDVIYSIKDYRKQKKTFLGGSANTSSATGMNAPKTSAVRRSVLTNSSLKKSASIEEKNRKVADAINDRIKQLDDLIKQEETVINQTGSALEQCYHDSQFFGSIEHIECNRILLIACQKKQSYRSEILKIKQKLANSSNSVNVGTNSEQVDESKDDFSGTLIFSEIQLPIKESYMNKLRRGDEKRIFHFICLVRHGVQVLQTQVISVQELLTTSKDTVITFPNRMAISDVDVSFKVKIDVYTMETTPKDVKHKRSPSKLNPTKFFSPFKNTRFNASSHHDHDQQHGHSTKTSNFIHVDTIDITQKDIQSNSFRLNISSSSIPLTGTLQIQVRCMPSKSIELRGFLTMFEDVSGYGSWDRRWCMLNNNSLSYWKYPEDEYRKSPLGCINLAECSTDKVSLLLRDLCARKYTFELICVKSKDTCELIDDSIITKSYEKFKFTKYWLSADTRENANDWLNHLNWALTNLRLWNLNSVKPLKKI